MPAGLLGAARATTVPDISVGHALLQMVLALVVIIVCIVVLSKVLARIRSGSKAPARSKGTGGLTVLSRQSLGKDLSIAAIQWGDREVLVGISGSTITFLNDPRGDETVPATLPPPAGATEPLPAAATTPFSPALLAAAARGTTSTGLVPAHAQRRGSLLEQLRDATARR